MKKMIFLLTLFLGFLVEQSFCFKNFVLISAPGSGKGTFSQYLVEKYGYAQICPGDIFRNEIKEQTELGKEIQPIVDRGDYVDEAIVCELIADNLLKLIRQNKCFIVDGFPRSDVSFEFLYKFLSDNGVIKDTCFLQFSVDDQICIDRISERLVCTECFSVYNMSLVQPKEAGKCDKCGTELSFRKADTKDIAKKRLEYFHDNIEPLISRAKKVYSTKVINAEASLEELRSEYEKIIAQGN
jgi:adenylate kinase